MQVVNNAFTSYVFASAKEEMQASIFTPQQAALLSNVRAAAAAQRIALKLDPAKFNEFLQQDAYLQARIELITELLDASDSSYEALIAERRNQSPEAQG